MEFFKEDGGLGGGVSHSSSYSTFLIPLFISNFPFPFHFCGLYSQSVLIIFEVILVKSPLIRALSHCILCSQNFWLFLGFSCVRTHYHSSLDKLMRVKERFFTYWALRLISSYHLLIAGKVATAPILIGPP